MGKYRGSHGKLLTGASNFTVNFNLRGARHNAARVRRRLLQMYNSATIATTRMQFAALQSHHGV